MGKRYAVLLGIKEVNPIHYDGQELTFAAEGSVKKFKTYFEDQEFDRIYQIEKHSDRNSSWLKNSLMEIRGEIKEGDLLVIYFCGHTYKLTEKFASDGLLYTDREEQGWVLYDRVFFHFELWEELKDMASGSRVVIFADTCFNDFLNAPYGRKELINIENFIEFAYGDELAESFQNQLDELTKQYAPTGIKCFSQNVGLYNTILLRANEARSHVVQPSVVIISASDRNSVSITGFGSKGDTTPFAEFFSRSVNHNPAPDNLAKLFQRMVSHFYKVYKYDDDPNQDERKAIPQWHYHQGEKFTQLRTQKPIFKSTNF